MSKKDRFEYVSDDKLDEQLSSHDEVVLVFHARWHKASQDMLALLKASRFKASAKILLMDIDENPHKPVEFAITRLPKLFVFRQEQTRVAWPSTDTNEGLEAFLAKNHLLEN